MASKFSNRSTEPELMDDLESSGPVIEQTLRELETINKWLGGNYVTTNGLGKLIKRLEEKPKELTIIDLGCGSGDMLKKIALWAREKSIAIRLIGVDANPHIISYAENNTRDYPEIEFKCINIFSDEFMELKCDVITATLFTHHFTDQELIDLFHKFKIQARLGVVINDIHRHWLAYYSIKLLTSLFSRSPMVKYDAAVSVLRAFHKSELRSILSKSQCPDYKLKWLWAFRWQLIVWY